MEASPAASPGRVVAEHVATIAGLEQDATRDRSLPDRISDAITTFTATPWFVVLHCVWFGGWMVVNLPGSGFRFDPFPYGLLMLIVSLEAIFLSAFVLRSQNQMAKTSDRRARLDLQINLLAESETTKILGLLHEIARHLDVQAAADDPDIPDMVVQTDVAGMVRAMDETLGPSAGGPVDSAPQAR